MPDTIEPQLAALREAAPSRLPADIIALTETMIADLERSHVAKAPDIGDAAPDFTLPGAADGRAYRLSEALRSGPVVLSFYRGQW